MKFESLRASIIESFNNGFFPEPIEFTEFQLEAIATTPGIDLNGTFADAPLERSLIRRYGLDADCEEHAWPAFASRLREEKSQRLQFSDWERKHSLLVDKLNQARAEQAILKIVGKVLGYDN